MKKYKPGTGCKDMLGSTEDFNRRLERRERRKAGVKIYGAPERQLVQGRKLSMGELRKIQHLYEECLRLNTLLKLEPDTIREDLWEVDHIRPISLGGVHEIENLRLLRTWANKFSTRSEKEIQHLTAINIKHLQSYEWPVVDWNCPTYQEWQDKLLADKIALEQKRWLDQFK